MNPCRCGRLATEESTVACAACHEARALAALVHDSAVLSTGLVEAPHDLVAWARERLAAHTHAYDVIELRCFVGRYDRRLGRWRPTTGEALIVAACVRPGSPRVGRGRGLPTVTTVSARGGDR